MRCVVAQGRGNTKTVDPLASRSTNSHVVSCSPSPGRSRWTPPHPPALLKPRLRLFRRSPSPRTHDATSESTPQARPLFSALHEDEDDIPTPRVHPRPIASINGDPAPTSAPVPAETPAARLRALLAREPRSPASSTPAPPRPSSSDGDSVSEPSHLGSSTSSVARESLKDIFSRALRDPGDTPEKGRFRRNSFDGSSMEITPVVDGRRGHRRPARKSLSDEETDKPKSSRRSSPSFRLSTAVTFDTLRARLMSSQSQLVDQNPPEALYEQSSLASASTSNAQRHPQAATSSSQFNPVHITPSVATDTPQPSFQMSSQLAFQSNLLEQDSEMQRAMGDVLNSENEENTASTSAPNGVQPSAGPSASRPTSSLGAGKYSSKLGYTHASYELGASSSSVNEGAGGERHSQEEENNHQREREWNRPRLPSTSSIPDTHRRHSRELHHRLSQDFRSPPHTKSHSPESALRSTSAMPIHRHLERRGSLVSLRSFDDDHGSRPSSSGSQADYRDRISELDRERSYEREREWNKRHLPSRPSSSMSTSSNHSFTHAHTHPPRSPSATPYLTPTHSSLQRKSSRTSLRSDSPASLASSRDSLKEREEGEKMEVAHERERNWNSPRPHWITSKSPSSHLKTQNQNNHSLRPTSSLPHLRGSNGHQDTSRASTKLRASPKVDFSLPMSPRLLRKSGDRSDLGLEESATGTIQSTPLNGSSPSKAPGATSRFGWDFARSPLPPLELDDSEEHRKSTSSPRASQAITSSQIPVRSRLKSFSSVGHAASDMSLTHVVGDESSFQRDYQNGLSENAELRSYGEPPATRTSWSQDDVVLGSDEESINDIPPESTTPRSNPPKLLSEEAETDTETEVLTSPSPQGSPQLDAPTSIPIDASLQDVSDPPHSQISNPPPEEQLINATPPGTPPAASSSLELPAGISPSFSLVTPPRSMSLGSSTSILDFRTPSPPHDLPDLPAPPLSSDDDMFGGTPTRDRRAEVNSNFTLTKTPKPPGAWTATPLPPRLGNRSSSPADTFSLESTPPAFTSTPLTRAATLPHMGAEAEAHSVDEDRLLTPVGSLSRARSLPLRTPAPPGAWMATPAQPALLTNGADQSQFGSLGRRKGLLKVRFDVAESETSATEGHPNSPLSAIRLVNPELPLPKLAMDGEVLNGVSKPGSISTVPQRPATPERPTTPNSRESAPSPRSLRKSPSVRLVDAFGRERVNEERVVVPPINLPNEHADRERKATTSPLTPRRSLIRIVDAMGRGVGEAAEIPDAPEDRKNKSFETDVSVVSDDTPLGHAEALSRMRKTLKDLAESLSDADRSEDLELNSSHIGQLEEVSQAARVARNQLAHTLHVETAKEHDLHRNNKFSAWTRGLLPTTAQGPWTTTIIYCGVVMQILLLLAMWRYAHAEARRIFYTTYYDPIYPEYTPVPGDPRLSGTLSASRPWTMFDSYEIIRREGWWSIGTEILRAARHVGDQAWERWGEHTSLENPS
ncbi:hypothetical protein JVU11DRAFT_2743 [Chiua virens]|nr:hypothetical protein JVU11DRAFT_2743 [Chiua virens]